MKKLLKTLKYTMIVIFSIVILIMVIGFLYMQQPQFGAKPTGQRLEKIKASPNYKNGSFENHSFTPAFSEGYSMGNVLMKFLFEKSPRTEPEASIPVVQTNLNNMQNGDWLVWFGHSSYLIQTDGIKILVDPVFSGNASPIPGSTKAFPGTNVYSVDDLPQIDYLFITHDHYDHLDYETIKALREKVKKVVCGLGVGAHLEHWGYQEENIIEMDWNTDVDLDNNLKVYGLTARHYSGRAFKRGQTLWMSYLLETPNRKIFIGGDSGYDQHFKQIGELHGPIDLAIIENGQYNVAWKAIHFLPGENLQAAIDLKARRVLPVHSGKFALALHAWDEPLQEMVRINQKTGLTLATPKIGEPVNLNDSTQVFTEWWQNSVQNSEKVNKISLVEDNENS